MHLDRIKRECAGRRIEGLISGDPGLPKEQKGEKSTTTDPRYTMGRMPHRRSVPKDGRLRGSFVNHQRALLAVSPRLITPARPAAKNNFEASLLLNIKQNSLYDFPAARIA
jgi:hypothetical protein